ncbi:uncharacterized protein CEXT_437181 [Caerostris extrusa]|uniref:Protein DEK n=1 Tax=Caerostris extrusa TaxID=172846 RepID=A0AAV4RVB8_CAEEX|nr:uncharacterized protein CEXT_437181 [Caerostris extrusa]
MQRIKKKRTFQPKDNNDDEEESKDEPRTRRLRSNTVEKGKEEPKKKAEVLGKRKPEISKSTPVSNKKQKISKDEDLKKGKKNTKVTGKRLRSAVQSSPKVQKSVKVTRTSLKQTEAKPETKRLSLRKATLLKTANAAAAAASASATASTSAVASTYISTGKSKVYILNCGENKNLSVIPEIKENVDKSDMKFLRYLYRILYDQWPPKEIDELKREILNFSGYNFKKKSQDLEKREQVLKKMPDSSVIEICKILDLKQGTKENMISDIIKFLLKPAKIVISTVDPLDPSMQPVVRLQRISISTNNTSKAITKSEVKPPVKISKRVRIPSVKLDIYDTDIKSKLFLPEKVPTKHKNRKKGNHNQELK